MRRRKEVKCPTCNTGKLYYTEDAICNECANALKEGQRFLAERQERIAEGASDWFALSNSYSYTYSNGDVPIISHSDFYTARDLVTNLIANSCEESERSYQSYRNTKKVLGPYNPGTSTTHMIRCSPAKAEEISKAFTALESMLRHVYAEGFEAGRALLMGLASGELSVRDYNDRTEKHTKH